MDVLNGLINNLNINKMERKKQYSNEELIRMIESLTPGGSEFVNDPFYCIEYIKNRTREIPKIILPFKRENERIKKVNDELASIVKQTLFMFSNEANYPEGTVGYRIAKEAEKALANYSNKEDAFIKQI